MGDGGEARRSYSPEMRTRAGLLVLASASAVALLSGCGHASRPAADSLSVAQVKRIFAAEGLPLVMTGLPFARWGSASAGERVYGGGTAYLDSARYENPGVDLIVTVFPSTARVHAWSEEGRESPYIDELWAGNIVVDFDRRSLSAPRIRTAIARLGRM
jgi:hypothetical protein